MVDLLDRALGVDQENSVLYAFLCFSPSVFGGTGMGHR